MQIKHSNTQICSYILVRCHLGSPTAKGLTATFNTVSEQGRPTRSSDKISRGRWKSGLFRVCKSPAAVSQILKLLEKPELGNRFTTLTLHTSLFVLHVTHWTLFTVLYKHYKLDTALHYTLYTVHCTLHISLLPLHAAHFTLHGLHFNLITISLTLPIAQCTVHSASSSQSSLPLNWRMVKPDSNVFPVAANEEALAHPALRDW